MRNSECPQGAQPLAGGAGEREGQDPGPDQPCAGAQEEQGTAGAKNRPELLPAGLADLLRGDPGGPEGSQCAADAIGVAGLRDIDKRP